MRFIFPSILLLACVPVLAESNFFGGPEIIPGTGEGSEISGRVFDDLNRNGRLDNGEPGVAEVLVSNGLDWALTDADGRYRIAVRDDMNLTMVQPSGWRVPTDRRRVPQFFYIHKPGGSPDPLRFGGLPDTGPAPSQVNFPLTGRQQSEREFRCAIVGDSQTYANREIGWLRNGVMTDLAGMRPDCMLYLGDIVGDDLDLLNRLLAIGATAGAAQWLVHGNHDFDFDARSDTDSADSWRQIVGPNYFAFERADVLFVVLDNVVYPCGERDGHDFCRDEQSATYNGRIDDDQVRWLAGLLERVPEDRLIVVATHIPLVSFVDASSQKHQTDNARQLHELLAGRPALSLSGHTHTIENHAPGQAFAGWSDATGIEALPFRHIVVGAASGAWYQGDFNIDGNPMALQRMGGPPGVLMLNFDGLEYQEHYIGARIDPERRKWLGFNTPAFRDWYDSLMEWKQSDPRQRHPIPPWTINDLVDNALITPDDLDQGVWLTANVWAGSAETSVKAILPDGRELKLERTQQGEGETARIGSEWADPFASQRQLSVARHAYISRDGRARAQGFELFQGNRYGPSSPRPQSAIADRNMHVWRVLLPADLETGVHAVEVISEDRHGNHSSDRILLEVLRQRPPQFFRHEPWREE